MIVTFKFTLKTVLAGYAFHRVRWEIAEITIEPKAKQVINLVFVGAHVNFRCQRCTVFCCKLGGPMLLPKDIERLKQAGYDGHIS